MELSRCINFLLSAAQHTVFQYLNGQLAPYGITPAQYGVLNCLWKHQTLTPKQLGELLKIEASSISSVLDRMQKSGLIERNINPDNRRVVHVSLTPKGSELQPAIELLIQDMNDLVMEPFSKEDRDTILRFLSLIANLTLEKSE